MSSGCIVNVEGKDDLVAERTGVLDREVKIVAGGRSAGGDAAKDKRDRFVVLNTFICAEHFHPYANGIQHTNIFQGNCALNIIAGIDHVCRATSAKAFD